jgi:6-phosphofructokinase 1
MKRIAILTAGGDCPGLNAVIRAVTARAAARHGADVIGILDGWDGLMEGRHRRLDRDAVRGILQRGGTILGTSRRDPYVHGQGAASLNATLEREGIDALVVIGGDGTLRTALRLAEEGVPLVGVPKTIDNDIAATDVTFGFDTAVQIATEAIDRITTTAESHDRVMLVEVMGRTRGWIATYAGIAGGADAILIPEIPFSIDAVAKRLQAREKWGARFSIVVAAEGAVTKDGKRALIKEAAGAHVERLGGIGQQIATRLEELMGKETRSVVLGHLQRGGAPTSFDRTLATRFGAHAVELLLRGETGQMVAFHPPAIVGIPLAEVVGKTKNVPLDSDVVATARALGVAFGDEE